MLKKIIPLIAVIAFALNLAACSSQPQSEAIDTLADSGLGALLPTPSFGTTEIAFESDEEIKVKLAGATQDNYKNYTETCKNFGFTEDADEQETQYEAYNTDGYRLILQYSTSDGGSVSAILYAPLEMNPVSWPTVGLATLIPAPESTVGSITSDTSEFFHAYVGETDLDAFNQYVKACQDAGFTKDYISSDGYYWAYDEHGVHLEVSYQGFNTMNIGLSAFDTDASFDKKSSETNDTPTSDLDSNSSIDSVTPEFKATMDEYEAFFDEYIEFMKTYQESDNALAMATDYASMMSRYADMTKKLEEVDESSLSTADAAYYAEVSARITQKLAEAA